MKLIIFYLLIFIAAAMPSIISPSTKEIVEDTKEELTKIYTGEDKDGPKNPTVTKGSAAVFATSDILTIASRNMDASKVMEAAMKVLCDPEASKTAQKAAMRDMETVQDYLRHSSKPLNAAALHSAPMPGCKKAHEQEERQKHSDAKAAIAKEEKNKKKKNQPQKLPEVLLLHDYVKMKKEEAALAPAKAISPDDKRLTRSSTSKKVSTSRVAAFDQSELPVPKDGSCYSKPEVIKVMKDILNAPGKSPSRWQIIKAIVSSKYVPVGARTIERLMNKDENGEVILDDPWLPPKGGQQKAVPDHVVAETAAKLRDSWSNKGLNLQKVVKDMIMNYRASLQEKAGLVREPEVPDKATINKYCVALAKHGVAMVDNVTTKTENRSVNESSQRGPVSNVGIVGATQFEVMDEEDHELNKELEKASVKTRALYELVKRARGGAPIWAVKPQLLFSTDDTTTYIFDGKAGEKANWVVASDTAVMNRGTQAIYQQEKVNMMNGLRVKVTFTFSGAGMTAPLFITVSGVSEEEMPDDEFLHVEVPGLAVGGAGVTVGNQTVGHVFFMRKGKGADEERVKYYQDKVLLPWIEDVRKDMDSNYVSGMPVGRKLKAVCWMDGALEQVASIADNPEKFAKAWVTVCKQNAGRTGVEQPADLAPVFKLFKQYIANTSSLDKHVTKAFRDKLAKAFKTDPNLGRLKLKSTHHNALLDFLAICASAATKACSLANVIKGFTESGLLDEETNRFPVLAKILATCKRPQGLETSVVDKVSNDLPSLLREVDEKGRISEKWFDHHDYPRDQNEKGEDVLRTDSNTQEHMQRSKVMTHEYQVESRLANIRAKIAKKRSKLVTENEEHEALVEMNRKVVEKLCTLAEHSVSESNLAHCTLAHFGELKSPELAAFIRAHDDTIRLKKDVPNKRGTLEEAMEGVDNRILRAFEVRTKPNRIEGQTPHDLEEFDEQTRPRKKQRPNIRTVTLFDESEKVTASSLLSNDEWLNYLVELFDMTTMMENVEVTAEEREKADVLTAILRTRLRNHLNNLSRVGSEARRNHWVWDWAEKNLPVCAAYMIAAGHVKPNFQSLGEDDCLLSSDSNKFIPIERFPHRHGVYLNKDKQLKQPIRSGKKTSFSATVEGFSARMEDHKKGCGAESPKSNFYKLYPSESSGRWNNTSKQGRYEDLEHLIAVSYDPKGDAAQKVDRDYRGGGVMILSTQDMQRVKSSMPKQPWTDVEKFQLLMSYLFELAYDVAIAPGFNVSESLGFENFAAMD
jgi:hypothetical protein